MLRFLHSTSKVVKRFLKACEQYGGRECAELQQATSEFLAAARRDPELLSEARRGFEELAPAAAAWLALTYGTAAETGFAPELVAAQLLPAFDTWVAHLPKGNEGAVPPTAQQERLLAPFPYVCQAVVSLLARTPDEREARYRTERETGRLDQLAAVSYGATWVHEALQKTSGRVLVLHPESRRGLELDYRNVSNCFHLFTLLQGAIGTRLPGGRVPDALTLEVARGETDVKVSDEAWWHYGDPHCARAEFMASIWGETNPRELLTVDGEQVLLLWKPLLGRRSWDNGYFRPQLAQFPPSAVIERELPDSEADARLCALRMGAV